MIRNYVKIAIRNLLRSKSYTLINICGLAVGIACCILILLYVFDELSYDRFHEAYDDIYRVILKGRFAGEDLEVSSTPAPMAFTMKVEIPEIIQATRIDETAPFQIRYGDRVFNESKFLFVDSTFFDVFSFALLQGDPRSVLCEPHTVVVTEAMAQKYFGTENPIGKMLIMEDGTEYKVTGVTADVPHNSHIEFDFLGSLTSQDYSHNEFWVSNSYQTYFRLYPGLAAADIKPKFDEIVRRNAGPQIMAATGVSLEEFEKSGNYYGYYLEPLRNIYLRSRIGNDLGKQGSIQYVYIFSIVAVFTLLIACVNFMNLATARSANRAKEVGIRKTMGSDRRNLIGQFLLESTLLALVAVGLAMLIVKLVLPYFNNLAAKSLSIHYFAKGSGLTLLMLMAFALIVGFIAGSYPAFYLSAFRPVEVLKGKVRQGTRSGRLRSILVILQFSISIGLIFGTIVVKQQLDFFRNKNLGFNKEQLLIVPRSDVIGEQYQVLKTQLMQNPSIVRASFASGIPGHPHTFNAHILEGAGSDETLTMFVIWTDADFAETFQLQLESGRFFSAERRADSAASVINTAGARLMHRETEDNRRLIQIGRNPDEHFYTDIIGVVKDFHFESLNAPLRPAVFYYRPQAWNYLCIRVWPEHLPETLKYIQATWEKFAPGKIFDFYFYDDHYNEFYRTEIRTGQVFSIFSGLAILIASLGLFGLANFMAERRIREIGIRKVLGASVPGVVLLLLREFIKWVLVANLIAWPLAYYLMRGWLQNFAYRTGIGLWPFIGSALIALLIAVLTVSYQSVRSALTNPAESLKYE